MQKKFEGKIVLVTGASSGIGRVTAIEFARAGAKVVLAARRARESQRVVKEIEDEGGEALFVQTDVTRQDSVRAVVERAVEAYGRVHDFIERLFRRRLGDKPPDGVRVQFGRQIERRIKRMQTLRDQARQSLSGRA